MGWELGYREGGLRMKQKAHIYEAFLFQRKVKTLVVVCAFLDFRLRDNFF